MLSLQKNCIPRIHHLALLFAAIAVPAAATTDSPETTAWGVYQNTSAADFSTTLSNAKEAGFMPVTFETSLRAGRYLSLWQYNKDSSAWAGFTGLSQAEFQARLAEYKDKGYQLEDQHIEIVGDKAVYSMIMLHNQNGGQWQSYSGLSAAEYENLLDQHRTTHRATDVEAVPANGTVTYSVILKENKDNALWNHHRDMSPAEYQSLHHNYQQHDFYIADFDCYLRDGRVNYAAIWHQAPQNQSISALQKLTLNEFNNSSYRLADRGMRMTDVELCPSANNIGYHYATVWQNNDSRYESQITQQAQQLLNEYVSAGDVPGASAVIMHNGKVLFRSGAGFVDQQQTRTAHSGSVYRLASIAKALVGTLAFDLVDEGLLNLDTPTRTLLPELSPAHTHTLRELLTNTGCVKGYTDDGLDDNNTQVQYQTARQALQRHLGGALASDDWIIDGCVNGTHHYSTHGYTLLTAAIEAQTGVSFASMIENRIAKPLQLSTLKVEDRNTAGSHGQRAALTRKGQVISDTEFQNASWKAGGSGMESSALHLAQFADAVMRNFYFSNATLLKMWSGGSEDSQYHGWSLVKNSNAGESYSGQIEKGGVNQGTDVHLRVDPASGLTVVAMTNTLLPKVRTPALTEKLMVLARKQLQSTDSGIQFNLSVVEE